MCQKMKIIAVRHQVFAEQRPRVALSIAVGVGLDLVERSLKREALRAALGHGRRASQ
jgi:hypothetical protein